MTASENQIVVYQPNETVRLDVRLENETVWLTQAQLCDLFGVVKSNVSYHLKNIFGTNELDYGATVQKIRTVRTEAGRTVSRDIEYFNLDVIISLGYRINSRLGIQFRQWATRVLKEYLLHGQVVNQRLALLEDKVDRRLAKHDDRIATLEQKVDFFVQTQIPPVQGVFYDGQLWDARALVLKLVAGAKRSMILIDNWATPGTLDLFAKKRK
ncbi:MAG: virulence RhuM family protein, partial [Kiritimatiellae bacterium]|nr:virulence RhuM family protein [Kiritimatiellia bacterium]